MGVVHGGPGLHTITMLTLNGIIYPPVPTLRHERGLFRKD